ncbi:hypothetical protein [Paenibacillus donghaensis]|uniref:Uncharacterized protein n=1 Tax=Paenibacillus donghaensis TaxID=414771 RepID=A0A2Z2KU48_9BACL|nr:hypothetical protein [Paenibacillus donghaensis]ASA24501.1 hypothetical protein B9T62_29370 [Paenibacillus donghaensis]
MVAQLLLIAAVYTVAAGLVHWLHSRGQTRRTTSAGKWIHYILIVRNHESVVEGYLRAIALQAGLAGKLPRVTLWDDGSTDGTLHMVTRLVQSSCPLDLIPALYPSQVNKEGRLGGIVIDLRSAGQQPLLSFMKPAGSRGYGSKCE